MTPQFSRGMLHIVFVDQTEGDMMQSAPCATMKAQQIVFGRNAALRGRRVSRLRRSERLPGTEGQRLPAPGHSLGNRLVRRLSLLQQLTPPFGLASCWPPALHGALTFSARCASSKARTAQNLRVPTVWPGWRASDSRQDRRRGTG